MRRSTGSVAIQQRWCVNSEPETGFESGPTIEWLMSSPDKSGVDGSAVEGPAIDRPAIPVAGLESPPIQFHFDNTYARLPERFYAQVTPTRVSAPRLIKLNVELARHLNLDPDALQSEPGIEILAGNRVAE